MKFNLEEKQQAAIFYKMVNNFLSLEKHVELKEVKKTRTNSQNSARWLYLSTIAEILNERGETFTPLFLKIEIPYTKDNLYHNYWQALKNNMYPQKKEQLNTKEFSDLVEMVLMMFAKVFHISIPFPNIADKLHKEES